MAARLFCGLLPLLAGCFVLCLVPLAAGQVATCPGEGRFPPAHSCAESGSVFKVCAKLLLNPGSQVLQPWGAKDYFAWMQLDSPTAAIQMMHDNNGDHACVSQWTFATVVNLAGCNNVHLMCESSDTAAMLNHYNSKGMTTTSACIKQHCPAALAGGQVDTIGNAGALVTDIDHGIQDVHQAGASLVTDIDHGIQDVDQFGSSLSRTPTLPVPSPSPLPLLGQSSPSPSGFSSNTGSFNPRTQADDGWNTAVTDGEDLAAQAAAAQGAASPPSAAALPQIVGSTPVMDAAAAPVAAPIAGAVSPASGASLAPSADTSGFGAAAATPTPDTESSSLESSSSDISGSGFGSVFGFILFILCCCCGGGGIFLATQHPQHFKQMHEHIRTRGIGGLGMGNMGGQYGQTYPQYGQAGQQAQMYDRQQGGGGGWGAYPGGGGNSFHGAQQQGPGSFHGAQQGSFSNRERAAQQSHNAYGPNPSAESYNMQAGQQAGYGGGYGGQQAGYNERDERLRQQAGYGGQQAGAGGYGGQSGGAGFQHDAYRRGMSGLD